MIRKRRSFSFTVAANREFSSHAGKRRSCRAESARRYRLRKKEDENNKHDVAESDVVLIVFRVVSIAAA